MTIPEPRFYLKEPNSTSPTLIYLQAKYSHNGPQRVMLTTGDKVLPKDWDLLKQRAISNKRSAANIDLNVWLDKISNTFKVVFRGFLINNTVPSAAMMKEKLTVELNIGEVTTRQPLTLYGFMEQHIQECRGIKSPNTIKSYISTQNRILEFGSYLGKQFDFSDIILEWRGGFLKYLQSFGVNRNTEGKHIKNLKVFLNEATERGINSFLAFRSKSFSKPNEEVNKIFLTINEIEEISKLNLNHDTGLDVVRDYFVVSCFTALRYSDLINIKQHHIKGDRIQMITKKTGKEVILPIADRAKAVFEKYNFNLPTAPTNQHFNRNLKTIGKLANLTEPVAITTTVGGVKATKVYEKWQLITTHTGRRSLVSNCILAGINPNSIMLLSGHKSMKVFQSYVRINEQQNADALSKHAFFSGQYPLKAV